MVGSFLKRGKLGTIRANDRLATSLRAHPKTLILRNFVLSCITNLIDGLPTYGAGANTVQHRAVGGRPRCFAVR